MRFEVGDVRRRPAVGGGHDGRERAAIFRTGVELPVVLPVGRLAVVGLDGVVVMATRSVTSPDSAEFRVDLRTRAQVIEQKKQQLEASKFYKSCQAQILEYSSMDLFSRIWAKGHIAQQKKESGYVP